MARIAVGRIGGGEYVGLLRARRHAGGWADALHVEKHCREFREIGKADELAHQRKTGAAGGRKGSRTVPGRAQNDADGRQFVLRLNDAIVPLAGLPIDPVSLAERLESVHERSGRRDRIPGAHGGTGVEAPQRRRRVAVYHDLVGGRVHRFDMRRQRALEVLAGVIGAQFDGVHVVLDQRLLGSERLPHRVLDHFPVQIEQ